MRDEPSLFSSGGFDSDGDSSKEGNTVPTETFSWSADTPLAARMRPRSLDEFVIEGITTTIDLHKKILTHKKFIDSDFDVNWLVRETFY